MTRAAASSASSAAARLRTLLVVVCVIGAILTAQVLRLQVFDPAVAASASGGIPRVVPIEAPRGLIVDRNGTVLARNTPRYRVTLIPGELPAGGDARRELLLRIARSLRIAYSDLEQVATSRLAIMDPFAPVMLRQGLTGDEAIALRAALAGVAGTRVDVAPARGYEPTGALAHILGYVGALPAERAPALLAEGYALSSRIGLAGVEIQYEEALRGTPGRRLVLSDPQGRELHALGEQAPAPGANVVLAIDLRLQRAAEAAVARGIDRGLTILRPPSQPRPRPPAAGAAVVLDVHTGEVLAMVSQPSYDANIFERGTDDAVAALLTDPARPMVDRSYMEVHAPGSIFKPLVAVAALQEGVVTPQTRIWAGGSLTVRSQYDPNVVYVFGDWAVHGNVDLNRAIARSSDVYFYELAGGYWEDGRETFRGLGADRLARWARLAGLGRPTGLDLPGEAPGLVPDSAWKRRVVGDDWLLGDTYTFGIGQGYLTTSLMQMVTLTAAIANRGEAPVPRVVRGIERGGVFTPTSARVGNWLPVSAEHLAVVRRGMASAAADFDGTAATGVPQGVTIGGKTGTAEFGQPYPDGGFDTHGWYIAFAPFDNPQIAVAVYLEYGVGQTHAGPVAKEIMEAYFSGPPHAGSRVAR
ncbi:MAG: penicillin-binding protein 2 [Dehalococcoidia bacterium]|nr:penicillin-binding protein 2 [Dehalococcoidia bacterium]